MRLQKKSLSRVTLNDLLRRKRTNLEKFLKETGIVTYELLLSRCASMGAVPPTEKEFLAAKGNPVVHEISSPTEGVVVLQPLPETLPLTAEVIETNTTVVNAPVFSETSGTQPEDGVKAKKKSKKTSPEDPQS